MSFLTTLVACAGDAAFTICIAWTVFGKVTDCIPVSSELMDSANVRRIRSKLISDSTLGHVADELVIGSPARIISNVKEK
jgi:hypothetical protein